MKKLLGACPSLLLKSHHLADDRYKLFHTHHVIHRSFSSNFKTKFTEYYFREKSKKFNKNITLILIAGVGVSFMIGAWRKKLQSIAEFHAEENTYTNLAFTSQSLDFKKTSTGMDLSEDMVSSSLLKEITTYLVFHVKSLPIGAVQDSKQISGGTCFVVSPIVGDHKDIYLVTVAHCVITPFGDAKRVGLIPKPLEKHINNQKLAQSTKVQKELIECEIVEFHYDGDNDIDYAILKCNAHEFITKNKYNVQDISQKYFIPKEQCECDAMDNEYTNNSQRFDTIVIGYPSKYKQFMDARTRNDSSLSIELVNNLMMTNEKSPIVSFGNMIGHQSINNNTLIRYFSNTINKGFSGGPTIPMKELNNTRNEIAFSGIVSLFDEKGLGSFCVENQRFQTAFSTQVTDSK
ncbi:hypothetical protein C9374_011923 [Naegleria lovaniensis]|uniref:Serine protease n=1 Tax=Naegleria lovaniensis TaxID=51637 RepID=A0AA88GFH4_NAELO|nr:uncharacterized protein C9374_011923 [Naegleria lovaniensis]KAG2373634.1 hypothetical protein C9374_011923 [Naegleria lovaniensis]